MLCKLNSNISNYYLFLKNIYIRDDMSGLITNFKKCKKTYYINFFRTIKNSYEITIILYHVFKKILCTLKRDY